LETALFFPLLAILLAATTAVVRKRSAATVVVSATTEENQDQDDDPATVSAKRITTTHCKILLHWMKVNFVTDSLFCLHCHHMREGEKRFRLNIQKAQK